MANILVKSAVKRLFRLVGRDLLTQRQTIQFLQPYQTATFSAKRLLLPAVADAVVPTQAVFDSKHAVPQAAFVWQYSANQHKTNLLPSGNLLTDGRVLCADFSLHHAVPDLLRPARRKSVQAEVLVAPFGHYQDGYAFGGYYDFMLLVAAKLSLIRETLPDLSLANATVAYPLFGTTYEQDFLTQLGFSPDRILDSRQHNVRFSQCVLANNGDWFYPSPANILALRRQLLQLVPNLDAPRERLYISRAGRRRVLNEDELVRMLLDYGFRIVDDKPRTLAEQAALYQRASFVMGPHGASFANMVCCRPGTHLFELFAPSYVPDFFLYMAQLLDMNYSAHVAGVKTYSTTNVQEHAVSEDIMVSVSDVERGLNRIFEAEHRQS